MNRSRCNGCPFGGLWMVVGEVCAWLCRRGAAPGDQAGSRSTSSSVHKPGGPPTPSAGREVSRRPWSRQPGSGPAPTPRSDGARAAGGRSGRPRRDLGSASRSDARRGEREAGCSLDGGAASGGGREPSPSCQRESGRARSGRRACGTPAPARRHTSGSRRPSARAGPCDRPEGTRWERRPGRRRHQGAVEVRSRWSWRPLLTAMRQTATFTVAPVWGGGGMSFFNHGRAQ
jgi:hypothetical protein